MTEQRGRLIADGGREIRFDYWEAQLRGALSGLDTDAALTRRENADDICVVIKAADERRDERAKLIRSLERRGFTILSETSDDLIRVDATAEPLNHPFNPEVTA